ncbi:TetR/AcrR family transcriptional regulator [Paraburkholderia strydomiana]|uniref:TetR/AcrR family transcriptional regulator n=1 Tax=Paraburkholderia strydomiana TaxID=1245417 RepID=UPI0038B91473
MSRQQLFEEVVDLVLSVPGVLMWEGMTNAPDVSTLCRDVAAALLAKTAPDITSMDGFLIMLRSANSGRATAILRRKFETHFARPLSELLPGEETSQRAAMFLAHCRLPNRAALCEMAALAQAKPDQLARQLEALFGLLIIGTPSKHLTG